MALSYFINRKRTTCVITFSGSFFAKDVAVLEQCLKEAIAESAKYYILNMGGVSEIDPMACRPFTFFQNGLRTNSRLYLCELRSDPQKVLRDAGVLRDGELQPNLMSCLQEILTTEKEKIGS